MKCLWKQLNQWLLKLYKVLYYNPTQSSFWVKAGLKTIASAHYLSIFKEPVDAFLALQFAECVRLLCGPLYYRFKQHNAN